MATCANTHGDSISDDVQTWAKQISPSLEEIIVSADVGSTKDLLANTTVEGLAAFNSYTALLAVSDVFENECNLTFRKACLAQNRLKSFIDMAFRLRSRDIATSSDYMPFEAISNWIAEIVIEHELQEGLLANASLAASVRLSIEQSLSRTILDILGSQIMIELKAFQATNSNTIQNSKTYDAFLIYFIQQRLFSFFEDYPVLGYLFIGVVSDRLAAIEEFFHRLEQDKPSFAKRGLINGNSDSLKSIDLDCSDSHDGHRKVIIAHFRDGDAIVYKPRSTNAESTYLEFVTWFNALSQVEMEIRAPASWDCGQYGWCEYVKHEPCVTKHELESYFKNAGYLFGVVTCLSFNDLHFENIISCGAFPCLVDAETLLHPRLHQREAESFLEGATAPSLVALITSSGLLPDWRLVPSGGSANLGGLSCFAERRAESRRIVFDRDGFPSWRRLEEVICTSNNVPFGAKKQLQELNIVSLVTEGFSVCLDIIQEYFPLIEQKIRDISDSAALKTRVIFRPTSLYETIAEHSKSAQYLCDGRRREYAFRMLAMDCHLEGATGGNIIALERTSLFNLDIPRFWSNPHSAEIFDCRGNKISAPLSVSGQDSALSNLAALRRLDRNSLIACAEFCVRSLYQSSPAQKRKNGVAAVASQMLSEEERSKNYSNFVLWAAQKTCDFWSRKGVRNVWPNISNLSEAGKPGLAETGANLYSGSYGIGIFWAAVTKCLRSGAVKQNLESILEEIRFDSLHPPAHIESTGLGLAEGVGGKIFASTLIGEILGDDRFVDSAGALVRSVDAYRTDSENMKIDALSGVAGLCIGLAKLHSVSKSSEAFDALDHYSRILFIMIPRFLESSLTGYEYCRPLTGISHGVSGIVRALDEIFSISGASEAVLLIDDLLAYESEVFCQENRNWPDYRFVASAQERPGYPMQWCHGAPGITLAIVNSAQIKPDRRSTHLLYAKKAMSEVSMPLADHLCCGSFGVASCLDSISLDPSLAENRAKSRMIIDRAFQRAVDSGEFRWALGSGDLKLGLFDGLSGVAYEILRQQSKYKLPNVLAL